jgi:RNA polymerase sigma factor (sigma-70 family)
MIARCALLGSLLEGVRPLIAQAHSHRIREQAANMSAPRFVELLAQVRAGDQAACETIVAVYGPLVIREAANRLGSSELKRALDAEDVCQSVLKSFLWRAARGQYVCNGPDDLVRLLVVMTRNKVATQANRQKRRAAADDFLIERELQRTTSTASAEFAAREIVAEMRRELPPSLLVAFDMRLEGYSWNDIAAHTGIKADTLRKQLQRRLRPFAYSLGYPDDEVAAPREQTEVPYA